MKKPFKKENCIKSFIVGVCLLLTGCGTIGLAQDAAFESAYENRPEEEPIDIYTSAARGIIQEVNEREGKVTICLMNSEEEMVLDYTGATMVQDKYGSALTMQQLVSGEITDITYNSDLERLGSVAVVSDSWSYEDVERYQLSTRGNEVSIGSDAYTMDGHIKVFSDGQILDISQVLKQDVLSFRGIGHEVVSVVVEKGHGYLELIGEEALLGGWIEVGQTVISQITEDMLITVPEGSYTVRVTAGSIDETREVVIERDRETVLDFSDIEIPKATSGVVYFDITPKEAAVYVDDKQIDTAYGVRLPLGIHKLAAGAEGYDTLSEYFEVKEERTTVRMNLTMAEVKEETVSGNGTGQMDASITIKGPAGVEVYQDNLYKGIAPVTYEKEAGDHVITLRKPGYITRSHSIYVDNDDRDVTYSFPELEVEKAASTVSDNSVSGNKSKKNNETVSDNSTVSGNNQKDEDEDGTMRRKR